MTDLQVSGSASFNDRVDLIFTEYKLSINKNKFISDTMVNCKLNYTCRIN